MSGVGSNSGVEGVLLLALLKEAVEVGLNDIVSLVVVRNNGVVLGSSVRGDNDIVVACESSNVDSGLSSDVM